MKIHSNTIIVMGGAGYIGSRLVQLLIDHGYRVIVIDDLSSGRKTSLPKGALFVRMSILSSKLVRIVIKEQPICVFHLAASKSVVDSLRQPRLFHRINVLGSKNVVKAAFKAGVKRVIFTSTAGVYGNTMNNRLQKETDTPRPSSPYAETKLETEKYLLQMNKKGMENIILRFSNVYGPGGHSTIESVIHVFIRNLLRKSTIHIHGTGMQTRDYIYIDDLVDACVSCISYDLKLHKKTPIYNISTGKPATVRQVLAFAVTATKRKPTIIYNPKAYIGQQSSLLDPTKTSKDLQWKPTVSLSKGIHKTAQFFSHI
jgi:UDP-glucose 4-epimerase